jgi:hypothetical protein
MEHGSFSVIEKQVEQNPTFAETSLRASARAAMFSLERSR